MSLCEELVERNAGLKVWNWVREVREVHLLEQVVVRAHLVLLDLAYYPLLPLLTIKYDETKNNTLSFLHWNKYLLQLILLKIPSIKLNI